MTDIDDDTTTLSNEVLIDLARTSSQYLQQPTDQHKQALEAVYQSALHAEQITIDMPENTATAQPANMVTGLFDQQRRLLVVAAAAVLLLLAFVFVMNGIPGITPTESGTNQLIDGGQDSTRQDVISGNGTADATDPTAITESMTDPQTATEFFGRGQVFEQLEEYQQALADYSRAIELDPEFADAYQRRGWVHVTLEMNEQALADFDMLQELTGSLPDDIQSLIEEITATPTN